MLPAQILLYYLEGQDKLNLKLLALVVGTKQQKTALQK